jgi:hypothetical protein
MPSFGSWCVHIRTCRSPTACVCSVFVLFAPTPVGVLSFTVLHVCMFDNLVCVPLCCVWRLCCTVELLGEIRQVQLCPLLYRFSCVCRGSYFLSFWRLRPLILAFGPLCSAGFSKSLFHVRLHTYSVAWSSDYSITACAIGAQWPLLHGILHNTHRSATFLSALVMPWDTTSSACCLFAAVALFVEDCRGLNFGMVPVAAVLAPADMQGIRLQVIQ